MLKRLIAFLLIYSQMHPWVLAQNAAVGLNDLPRLVREKNQRVQAAHLMLTAAEREAGHFSRSFLPKVSADVGYETFKTGIEDTRSEPYGSVGAEVNVFRSGKDDLDEKGRSAGMRAAQAELENVYRSQLEAARETFWVLAFQREMAVALQDALKSNDAFLKAATQKINSGLSTSTDRLEFEMYRHELEQDGVRLRTEENRAVKSLALLLNDPAAIQTPAQVPHDHDNVLMTAAFDARAHPRVRALEASTENQRVSATSTRRWEPSVDLYANYSLYTFRDREYDDRADRDETVAGGKLSVPIFNRLTTRAEGQAAMLRADSNSRDRDQTERELTRDAAAAKEALENLHGLVHAAEESVTLGERYLKNTLIEYTRGVKNSPDLLGALEKLVDVKRRHAEIRLDYQIEKAKLLALLGQ